MAAPCLNCLIAVGPVEQRTPPLDKFFALAYTKRWLWRLANSSTAKSKSVLPFFVYMKQG